MLKATAGNEMDWFAFLTAVTTKSFAKNPHGDGVYFDSGMLVKSRDKLDFKQFMNQIRDSHLILSHQRFATSGHEDKYIQPFDEADFILAHNGVMGGFARDGHSDTYIVFGEFIKEFNKAEGNREKRIFTAIKNIFTDEAGRWSVGIFDKREKRFYYFKDGATNIHFVRSKDKKICYLTTLKSNLDFTSIVGDFSNKTIEPYKLYRFDIGERITFKMVGVLKKRKKENLSIWDDRYIEHTTKDLNEILPTDTVTKDYETRDFVTQNKKELECHMCLKKTHNIFTYSGGVLCDDCLNEYWEEFADQEFEFRVCNGLLEEGL